MYNTSLYRIAYPCQVIAQYWLNYRLRQGQGLAGMLLVNALVLGNLCKYRRKSYIANILVYTFNHFDVIGPKATEFGKIMQINGH